MQLKEYQKFAAKGILSATLEREPIVAFALGLVGETGEVVDDIKKRIFHGRNIPIEHTEEELGDVMWYVANVATALNLDLETIIQKNVEKLQKRYPEEYKEQNIVIPKEGIRVMSPTYGKVKLVPNGPHIAMYQIDGVASEKFIKFLSKEEVKVYVRQGKDLPWY